MDLKNNKLWNSLEIIKEKKYIVINGINLPSNKYTIGWLINVLAVYCNFRKAYMDISLIDRTTKEQNDLVEMLSLSKHFGCKLLNT